MENIKDIIEKARAVVASHAPGAVPGSHWRATDALRESIGNHPDVNEWVVVARLLVAAAMLPMDAFNQDRALAVTLTCPIHGVEGCAACGDWKSRREAELTRKQLHRERRQRRADEPIWQRYYAALIGKGLAVDEAVMRSDAALAEHRKRWPSQD